MAGFKKLDFKKPILGLDGKPVENQLTKEKEMIGKVLATVLALQSKGPPVKFMTWAMAMYEGKTIELDPDDITVLSTFVEHNEQMTNMLKHQILTIINEK